MQQYYRLKTVSALFADADARQCDAIRVYAHRQGSVSVCAVVSTVADVLGLLRGGLQPQVLVLDALLQGEGIFYLLQQIGAMEMPTRPAILITCPANLAPAQSQKFLTLGAKYTILKPYTLEGLFIAAYEQGSDETNRKLYHIHKRFTACMRELSCKGTEVGYEYLEQMAYHAGLTGGSFTAEQLYSELAEATCVQSGAITSGINRINDYIGRVKTPCYREICAQMGLAPGRKLTTAKLIYALTKADFS